MSHLRQVKLEKKMNTISGKAFLHCKSIEYIGYDDLPGKICWDNEKNCNGPSIYH